MTPHGSRHGAIGTILGPVPSVTDRLRAALEGRYGIERELGAGGMATVYLAHDMKHDRKVALKVLKPELAAVLGGERFVVEIKTTASLQHPHILPLFDSGTADGFLYYVMPFIRGETLRDKLNRETQLGVDEAVSITRDVADALDYAHRHGVVHRDIKPENILLHDGRPIVADFGIALAVSAAAGGRMTETGLSLGTPHYMSPEQATADKEITGRSDVYSLASVLYEMLAGQPPHQGGSAQQVIMKIIAEPVDAVTRYRKSVPPNVTAALAKALEKLPADRFESAKAFRDALNDKGFTTVSMTGLGAAGATSASRWNALTIAMAIVAFLSTAALVASRSTRSEPEPPTVARYSLAMPGADSGSSVQSLRGVAISADGSRLAWIASDGSVWTRQRDALEVQRVEIVGERAQAIALSPEGRELAFTQRRELQVISLSGGGTRQLADSVNARWGIDWSGDGHLYFVRNWRINRVPQAGGVTEPVTVEDDTIETQSPAGNLAGVHLFPRTLPGNRGLVFLWASATEDSTELRAWDFRTRRSHVIGRGVPLGYANGHLLSVRVEGTLLAMPFDLRRLQARSEQLPVERHIIVERGEIPLAAVSASGAVILSLGVTTTSRLARVSLDGRVDALPVVANDFRGVRLSPDGRKVAYGSTESIFVHDLSIGSTRQLVPNWNSWDPVWSPDGQRITFHTVRPANDSASTLDFDGFEIAADGSGNARRLFRDPRAAGPQHWTTDGKLIAHGLPGTGAGSDLYVVSFEGDSARVQTLLDAPWAETMPNLSPDGKWIAYRANPSNAWAVYVRRFPDAAAGVWQISEGNGTEPMWSRDGKTLYYWDGSALIAARLRTSPDFGVQSREVILRDIGYMPPTCCRSNYDVLGDDRGFIMVLNREGGKSNDKLILIEGLLTTVKRASTPKR
jgi:eukaryotic-like serine/threonine-protein kinase